MDNELKSIFLKLNHRENKKDFYDVFSFDFFGLDGVFDSIRDFVYLYKERNYAIHNRNQSSWRSFLKVDCVELIVLLACSPDNDLEKFIEEISIDRLKFVKDDEDDDLMYEVNDFFNINSIVEYLENLNFSKEKIASWYMKLLEKNNTGMQTSRIFNDSRNVNLFSLEQLNEIAKYKKKMARNAMKEYKDFMRIPLSDIEIEDVNEKLLFDYMILNFDNDDEELRKKREKIIEKIVNDVFYASNLQKEFVVRIAALEKCKRNNLPFVNIIFSDDVNAYGSYFSSSNIIDFYDNRLRNASNIKELTKLIDTIEHEVEHYLQHIERYNGVFSLPSYCCTVDNCLNDYLNLHEYDDYSNNYNYREIEKYARVNGTKDACDFISKYYKGDLSFLVEYKENAEFKELQFDSLGYHLDCNNNFESRGIYNIKIMCEYFLRAPNLLGQYPILKKFFSNNGTLKDWQELSKDYFYLKEDEKIIYSDVIDYMFSRVNFLSEVLLEQIKTEDIKGGFISMLKDDLTRKVNQLFLIGRKIDNINTNSVKGMDEKKYCYDVFDKYLDSISMEYKFLVDNLFDLDISSYLEKINSDFKTILDSNFTMYSDSKRKLEEICNYNQNINIDENRKL